jgi:hypothetical protein
VRRGTVARTLRVDLRYAGHQDDAVRSGDLPEPFDGRAGHFDRFPREKREGGFRPRIGPAGELPGPDGVLVRPTARELVVAGEAIRLRPLECAVLRVLLDHRGEVVGVDTLLNEVWGPERASRNLVEAQISRIRAKLRGTEADGLITTVHGVGYLVR